MEKTITIDGRDLVFKATASTPHAYRRAFGRDIYVDIKSLYAGIGGNAEIPVECLNAFENIAFCFNAQAEGKELKRETIEKDMEEWLEQFEMFSIYRIFPQLMELWRMETEQTVEPKNQPARQTDH